MILPDDVLTLIRAYSKPLMRFSGEFRKILIELGLRDWPEIRDNLCKPHAESVVQALLQYKDAYLVAEFARKSMLRPRYPRILSLNYSELVKRIHVRDKLYRKLQILLIGEALDKDLL